MSLYNIPLTKRFCTPGTNDFEGLTMITLPVNVNGNGVYITRPKGTEIGPDYLKNKMVGTEKIEIIIDAENPEEALHKLFEQCVGFKVGGKNKKALSVNKKEYIKEYPDCSMMLKNKDNFFCMDDDCGCILTDNDPPEDCIIKKYNIAIMDLKISGELKTQKHPYKDKEYEFIMLSDMKEYLN